MAAALAGVEELLSGQSYLQSISLKYVMNIPPLLGVVKEPHSGQLRQLPCTNTLVHSTMALLASLYCTTALQPRLFYSRECPGLPHFPIWRRPENTYHITATILSGHMGWRPYPTNDRFAIHLSLVPRHPAFFSSVCIQYNTQKWIATLTLYQGSMINLEPCSHVLSHSLEWDRA